VFTGGEPSRITRSGNQGGAGSDPGPDPQVSAESSINNLIPVDSIEADDEEARLARRIGILSRDLTRLDTLEPPLHTSVDREIGFLAFQKRNFQRLPAANAAEAISTGARLAFVIADENGEEAEIVYRDPRNNPGFLALGDWRLWAVFEVLRPAVFFSENSQAYFEIGDQSMDFPDSSHIARYEFDYPVVIVRWPDGRYQVYPIEELAEIRYSADEILLERALLREYTPELIDVLYRGPSVPMLLRELAAHEFGGATEAQERTNRFIAWASLLRQNTLFSRLNLHAILQRDYGLRPVPISEVQEYYDRPYFAVAHQLARRQTLLTPGEVRRDCLNKINEGTTEGGTVFINRVGQRHVFFPAPPGYYIPLWNNYNFTIDFRELLMNVQFALNEGAEVENMILDLKRKRGFWELSRDDLVANPQRPFIVIVLTRDIEGIIEEVWIGQPDSLEQYKVSIGDLLRLGRDHSLGLEYYLHERRCYRFLEIPPAYLKESYTIPYEASGRPSSAGIEESANPRLAGRTDWQTSENLDRLRRVCLLYTSPSPRDRQKSRMPSSA
jgi:hypothetical protein